MRTAVRFTTRDKTWTDEGGVTHRLVGTRRKACEPYMEHRHDLKNPEPYRQADCVVCLSGDALEKHGYHWAILQEAVGEFDA